MAVAIAVWVRERPPVLHTGARVGLVREAVEGYQVVFRSPVMRAIALIVFTSAGFGIVVPEGLAASWAARLGDDNDRGFYQAAIMVAAATGFVIGTLIVSRLVSPAVRVSGEYLPVVGWKVRAERWKTRFAGK